MLVKKYQNLYQFPGDVTRNDYKGSIKATEVHSLSVLEIRNLKTRGEEGSPPIRGPTEESFPRLFEFLEIASTLCALWPTSQSSRLASSNLSFPFHIASPQCTSKLPILVAIYRWSPTYESSTYDFLTL